jgi:amino acid transporter
MMFWSWIVVIIGQTLVALVFAELASHYPVAGSVYQWSKRLSHRSLGWFTGWFYFFAQLFTVTAVAVIVSFVVDGILGSPEGFLDSPDPTGMTTMFTFIALVTLVITTAINAFGVRFMAILNNIGVGTEILGMLVFALILLFFSNHQTPDVLFKTFGAEQSQNGDMLATFMLGFFMSVFIVYGFDTAGTFGEETVDPGRQAPRGVLSSIWISGAVGTVFLLAIILSIKDIPGQMAAGLGGEFPIANTILDNLTGEIGAGFTLGELYLVVILVSVFVCTLAIRPAVGVGQPNLQDARERGRRGRRAGGPADPARWADRRFHALDRRDRADLSQLLPLQHRRGDGPPQGLAPHPSLVQPGSMGDGGEHPGAHLRRRYDHQHRPLA